MKGDDSFARYRSTKVELIRGVPMVTPATIPLSDQATMSEDEFLERYGDSRYELHRGIPVEMPMPGLEHGKICFRFALALGIYVETNDSGHVVINDSLVRVRTDPYTLLGPDIAYYSYARLPKGKVTKGVSLVTPDLAVEVRSPTDAWGQVIAKVSLYLDAGVRAVVALDAATESAAVYRAALEQVAFGPGDELVLRDVLPGFAARVGRFFE